MIPLKDNIPTDRPALVTIALIVANVVAYVISIRHAGSLWSGLWGGPPNDVVLHYGAIPNELTNLERQTQAPVPTLLTPFTAMFLHGGLLHLGGNMLFLWIFGNNVEDSMGRVRFIAFYLLGGLAALALQTAVDPSSTVPTVGASGAIAAVLGGYLLLYPRARVLSLVFIIFFVTVVELPAVVMLGFWFVVQVLYGYGDLTNPTGGGGGVAYFAHVGGFVFGIALIHAFAKRRKSIAPRFPVY